MQQQKSKLTEKWTLNKLLAKRRTNSVVKYINTIRLEGFVQEQERYNSNKIPYKKINQE